MGEGEGKVNTGGEEGGEFCIDSRQPISGFLPQARGTGSRQGLKGLFSQDLGETEAIAVRFGFKVNSQGH